MIRNRKTYIVLIILTIIIGLASRKFPHLFPVFFATYLGDTLWALLVFWLLGFLFPKRSTFWVTTCALIFSYLIEISQLYHAEWIDALRATTFGALVLGHGFLWSDIFCYTIGIAIGVLAEWFILFNKKGRVVP
jgi:hypothetical protein